MHDIKKSELRVYFSQFLLYNSQLRLYIMMLWLKSQNCEFILRNSMKKIEIKCHNYLFYFYSVAETGFYRNQMFLETNVKNMKTLQHTINAMF